jgi:uncharacterized DUF497 family protein
MQFEWDENKNLDNIEKHNISFEEAQYAFDDIKRIIRPDKKHSKEEKRFFCYGKINGEVATIRFTMRDGNTRIIGAGYWRRGRYIYEKKNSLHRRA